jgi:DNA primase catalytic core
MARIPPEELERIKREVSVERLIEGRGIALARCGKDLRGHCPFHDDQTPSLLVSPDKNLWHCMGACQAGGGPIDWVMRIEGVSFRYAVELLRHDATALAAPSGKIAKHGTAQKLEVLAGLEERDEVVMQRVVTYYCETLQQSPEALSYLRKRGLDHVEMIERFQLGFANRTLGYRLPQRNRQAGAALREQLTYLGVYRESGHERFNGSIVIPIFDVQGRVVGMYGRKISEGLRPGTPLHMYLPGPHRGVFNREALSCASKEVIVCEALLDALTFWCAGYRNVTSAYGVEGFTDELFEALKESGIETVKIAYDRDDAGDKAAEKLSVRLGEAGIASYRVMFPKGMDVNEYALKVKPAEKSLGAALRSAIWMGKGQAQAKTHREEKSVLEAEAIETEAIEAEAVSESPQEDDLISLAALPAQGLAENVNEAAKVEPPQGREAQERIDDQEVVFRFGERRWRIRGLAQNTSYEQLRVNVLVSREEASGDAGPFHVDTLELYSARHRALYLKEACSELSLEERLLKKDLGKVLCRLEALQQAQIQKTLEKKSAAPELDETEKSEALALLCDEGLLERILADYERCGVVGERTNKLICYIAAVSRKLDEPLAVVIQSSSAAGKSSLMEAALAFMPEEERVAYSAMTGQSLFYMGETDLKHKILAIAEEEGAHNAAYALKLLQSEGQLTIASTGKDASTGRLVTHEYRVEGPVMIFLTTTAIDIDEELLNRCIVLCVDEGRAQTQAIHALQRQRQTLSGLLAKRERERIVRLHQNAQRLIKPLLVANPYADELTFLDHQTRTRRDHMKYLTLIRAIALLHQHQRPVREVTHCGEKLRYIEVSRRDIELAHELADEALGRTLDELPVQTRRLLMELEAMVLAWGQQKALDRSDVRISRKDIRVHTGMGDTQLKVHLGRLVELEYLAVHREPRSTRFVYELLYEGQGKDGKAFLSGLKDSAQLGQRGYDSDRSGGKAHRSPPGRASVGGPSGLGRSDDSQAQTPLKPRMYEIRPFEPEKGHRGDDADAAS